MSILKRASFGYLLRHPWQLGPALAGICIGVAVIVAVDLANESARRAFLMSMNAVVGEATHQIVSGPQGVSEALYAKLRARGMRNIAPVVEAYVYTGDTTLQLLGVDVFAERTFRTFTASGSKGLNRDTVRRLLTEPGSVLLDERTAAELELSPDEAFSVVANGREFEARLVGLIGEETDRRLDNLLIADIATAQEWLDQGNRLSRIDVRLSEGADDGAIAEIESELPQGSQLLDAEGRSQSVSGMIAAFMTNLTAMSLLALLVGVFLIYNSVSFAVLQRRGLFGVLRALGVTRGQTFRVILAEGLLLGIVGSVLGAAAGIALGQQLLLLVSRSINDLYFVLNVTDLTLNPASIAKGFAAGLGATLFAAAAPAWEAASSSPRLAMTRSVLERRAGKLLVPITTAGIAIAVLAYPLLEISEDDLVAGLGALFMVILGFALCVPLVVKVSSSIMAPLAAAVGGVTARLAISGISASLSRTAVAIVALAVAVSATIGVGTMIGSFRGSVSDWLDATLRSDIYVGVDRGVLEPALVADLLQVPGIAAHRSSRHVWLQTGAGRIRLSAIRRTPGADGGNLLRGGEPQAVWQAFDDKGAVLVSDSYAYRHQAEPGDTVTLPTGKGVRTFAISAIYQSYDAELDAVMMSRNTYDVFWDDPYIDSLGIDLEENTSAADIMERLREVSAGRQALVVRSNREIRELSMQIFDRTFVITDVLYWLALGVATIGILGAMFALQLERAREFAVLRALGMTPGQLGRMVMLQTGSMGFLCGLAAIPLGLVMAWLLINVINRRAFGWQMDIDISAALLAGGLALAVGTALAAGIYPARRAARASPALAMREE